MSAGCAHFLLTYLQLYKWFGYKLSACLFIYLDPLWPKINSHCFEQHKVQNCGWYKWREHLSLACLALLGSFLLAHSQPSPHSGYVSRLISPTLPGNMKYCLRFYFSLRGEWHPTTLQMCGGVWVWVWNSALWFVWLTHRPVFTLQTAGFNQTDSALEVYLQPQQRSSSQEKIWTQGENTKEIWIASDITFQTSQPAKVSGNISQNDSRNQKMHGKRKWWRKK